MKTRFGTTDIVAIAHELKEQCIGMRVHQVYDVDTKTYLLKLNRYDEKVTILLESGIRVHITEFDWPKNLAPSGFSMKLRKHIKNKRLENVTQLGVDRILDFQFGINEAAYHLILELYDRGNLMLTDCEYTILNILRPRTPQDGDVKFIVRGKYPVTKARQADLDFSELKTALETANSGENLRQLLLNYTFFGPVLVAHIMSLGNIPKDCCVGKGFNYHSDISCLMKHIEEGKRIMRDLSEKSCDGYVIQKEEIKNKETLEIIMTNVEFHPFLFDQFKTLKYTVYPTFNKAVDNFFSTMESQKIDLKTLQKEKEAMKKLENVKKDHEQRISNLHKEQFEDSRKAELIELNLDSIDSAISIIRSAIANQIPWNEIWDLIQEAQAEGDHIAKSIKKLKLEINHFTMLLRDPFSESDDVTQPQLVDINLDLSAYANARKYYNQKRQHATKEQKTLKASEKAFKNAERKTKETLKEVAIISNITKARKPMWFEKFIWCISSENYLIIAGRDMQQNEVLVKRYMKTGDIYVHADIHGASTVIIKNPHKSQVPPKTLNEAGTVAVCYSTAWIAKVITNAWWVYHHQVTKTAPTGEYLTTGSFMVRGKKNYLLPSHLILGFGFLFKLHEDSVERHQNDRKIKSEENVEIQEEEQLLSIDSASDNELSSNDEGSNSSIEHSVSFDVEKDDATEKKFINEEKLVFPDTEINFEITELPMEEKTKNNETQSTTLIISAGFKSKPKKQQITKPNVVEEPQPEKVQNKQNAMKRGQRAKLKKIKEKYKDQDEEERELRMKILASAGTAKQNKKTKKKDAVNKSQKTATKDTLKVFRVIETRTPVIEETEEEIQDNLNEVDNKTSSHVDDNEVSEESDNEQDLSLDETNLLNSLTGCPLPEDGLLFAVPVCGPYTAMQNYKYKVKVIPGTGRRGKAAKTTLNNFLHDKNSSQIERDCLKSVKDQDISRNFPGKVKLSHGNFKKK